MAPLLLVLLLLAFAGGSDAQGGQWCVCKADAGDAALQKAIDYACGAGANCSPILQNGPCYQPNSVASHCSYAANGYFQNKGRAPGSCDFSGVANIVTADPSTGSCTYPSSATSSGTPTPTTPTTNPTTPTTNPTTPTTTPTTPNAGTPTTLTPPTSTFPGTTTPSFSPPTGNGNGFNSPTGVFGNIGPSGGTTVGISPDGSLAHRTPTTLTTAGFLLSMFLSYHFIVRA